MKLEVKDLYKSFGGTEVLHGISFSVESGRALGLLGRNGAGKTTTIRILMQVFAANKGTVTLDGVPFYKKDRHRLSSRGARPLPEKNRHRAAYVPGAASGHEKG